MMNARDIALNLIKPGVKCSEIDIKVREYLLKQDIVIIYYIELVTELV